MRLMIAVALLTLAAGPVLAASNSLVEVEYQPYSVQVPGDRTQSIVVYSDDAYGYDYVLQALNQLGLGYDLFWADYSGFESAVGSGVYDLIIVNHDNYYELSYAWDEIYNEMLAGKRVILNSFDWDGSNDYSGGYSGSILDLMYHIHVRDIGTPTTIYGWPTGDCVFAGTDGIVDVWTEGYLDDGDALQSVPSPEAWDLGGWTPTPISGEVAMNIVVHYDGTIYIWIVISWCMDEYDGLDAVQIWKNTILAAMGESPSVAMKTTWGGVKALYE
jgi:hypothetical protein